MLFKYHIRHILAQPFEDAPESPLWTPQSPLLGPLFRFRRQLGRLACANHGINASEVAAKRWTGDGSLRASWLISVRSDPKGSKQQVT
jgi:hypothetical protein